MKKYLKKNRRRKRGKQCNGKQYIFILYSWKANYFDEVFAQLWYEVVGSRTFIWKFEDEMKKF